MTSLFSPYLVPIFLLVASNVFMTFATPFEISDALTLVVFISWGIALMEYWLAIPANPSVTPFIRRPSRHDKYHAGCFQPVLGLLPEGILHVAARSRFRIDSRRRDADLQGLRVARLRKAGISSTAIIAMKMRAQPVTP